MKNIHVLPTDKPSILSDCVNYKHVYITSDEEIKEGDWCLDLRDGSIFKIKLPIDGVGLILKLILTTDPDLIDDGIQAIDDEFLEWFVKNPSCEEVVTERVVVYDDNNNGSGEIFHSNRKFAYEIIIPQEEKQETLEEAAEKYTKDGTKHYMEKTNVKLGFIAGAKSDAARDYWFKIFKEQFIVNSSGK